MFGGKCSLRVTKVQELWNLVTPAYRDALLLSHESPGGDVAVVVKVRHHNTEPQMGIMLSLLFSLYVFDKVGHHNNALVIGMYANWKWEYTYLSAGPKVRPMALREGFD